jgi:CBS domain-containing protein
MRVIAEGLKPEETSVAKVMTRNPIFVTGDTLAVEALQKMVQGKISCCCSSICSPSWGLGYC